MGLPTFLIGATVVSLATTLPEILVSVFAAAQGKAEMAVGNALGSVTANTALVLASGMVLMPSRDLGKGLKIPCVLLLGAIIALWVGCWNGAVTRWASLILGLICLGFLYYNIHLAKGEAKTEQVSQAGKWLWKFLLGAAGIVAGSQLLISGAEGVAKGLGVPERTIAVTLMAIGTGLPELVTTLTAVKKGEAALSVGNIIGANILDLTLILPLSAWAAGGLPLSEQNLQMDLPVCAAVLLTAAMPLLLRGKSSRVQGVVLWSLYVYYLLCLL
jgi:cation:H+ antiporter